MTRRLSDRIAVATAWLTGLGLIVAVGSVLVWLAVGGIRNVDWGFLTGSPGPGSLESGVAGGIFDPLVGTLIVTAIGILVALPLGVGTAVFLAEYRRPLWLARMADSGVDMIFGVPSIVFALFGVAVFANPGLLFLSERVESSGLATGSSFLCASLILSLIAYPPVVRATESAILAVPARQREAAYALGKGRVATLRRVVLPGARPGIVTGVVLGIGRIVGDTAIAVLLLGGTVLAPFAAGWWKPDEATGTLRGPGSTLTTYIYYASPAGEGNTEGKAYGAAFVLMVLILVVNFLVRLMGRRRGTVSWR